MDEDEWDAQSWAKQRMYAEGFISEGLVQRGDPEEASGAQDERQPLEQIAQRTVDTGEGVIDLAAMRDQLAAAR